ncbi:MAG: DUF5668 domain-containing protein [Acidobacteriota bacterium]
MTDDERFTVPPQVILGVLILIAGVIFLLDNLGIVEEESYLRYWPAILIAIGIPKVMQSRDTAGLFVGFLFMGLGTILLLDNLRFIRFDVWDFWPLILVFIGGSLILRAFFGGESQADPNARVSGIAVMGGVVRKCNSPDFRSADLTAIMGGFELDLREASIEDGTAAISTFALWGGIEIKVPSDWSVASKGIALLGGFEDATQQPLMGSEKRLIVRGFAIMGGVEIKN